MKIIKKNEDIVAINITGEHTVLKLNDNNITFESTEADKKHQKSFLFL